MLVTVLHFFKEVRSLFAGTGRKIACRRDWGSRCQISRWGVARAAEFVMWVSTCVSHVEKMVFDEFRAMNMNSADFAHAVGALIPSYPPPD